MGHSIWTFQVEGGSPFRTQVGGNPSVEHMGGTSVFHLVLEEADAQQFVSLVEEMGGKIEARPSRRQSKEQETERMSLLGVGKEESLWPCGECPTCYWFDPVALKANGEGDPCGFTGWPEETKRVSLESTKAVDDLEKCPLRRM